MAKLCHRQVHRARTTRDDDHEFLRNIKFYQVAKRATAAARTVVATSDTRSLTRDPLRDAKPLALWR